MPVSFVLPKYGFANALGALDKLKEYAEHFGKAFMKGQTAAAALFSPGRYFITPTSNPLMASLPDFARLKPHFDSTSPNNGTENPANRLKFVPNLNSRPANYGLGAHFRKCLSHLFICSLFGNLTSVLHHRTTARKILQLAWNSCPT
ncbi:MAG: hypothetical protein WD397_08490 [Wenzhouxiangellaceae bacterium]